MNRLPQEIIDVLVSKMYPPTGIWRDFQHDYDSYKWLQTLVKMGKLNTSDLPPEPQPSDYSDTTSAGTR